MTAILPPAATEAIADADESKPVWTESAKPGNIASDGPECAWRLFQKIEDPQKKILNVLRN